MKKKKIVALCLIVCLLSVAVVGGTLAYFTDTDAQVNTFTVGNVKIDLFEDFNTDKLELIPAVGSIDPQTGYGTFRNTIEKEVYVENTGSQPAYVRVHIAVPAFTRANANGGEDNINVISLLYDEYNTVDGTWIWGKDVNSNYPVRDGGEWNMYRDITISGVPYKVYVVTYETALAAGETTPDAINKVYMDPKTTQDEIAVWDSAYTDIWSNIYVVAEAVQAEGFDDPITALNEAFGVPGTYAVDFLAAAEGESFVEMTSRDGN